MIKIQQRVHPSYRQFEELKRQGYPEIRAFVGKYQYQISSEKGRISLVRLPSYLGDGMTIYEIYCLEGDLFDDCERFSTFQEAIETAKKYLE